MPAWDDSQLMNWPEIERIELIHCFATKYEIDDSCMQMFACDSTLIMAREVKTAEIDTNHVIACKFKYNTMVSQVDLDQAGANK